MTPSTCTRCGTTVVKVRSGNYVTGNGKGWILPSHLNHTCDGMRLHTVDQETNR